MPWSGTCRDCLADHADCALPDLGVFSILEILSETVAPHSGASPFRPDPAELAALSRDTQRGEVFRHHRHGNGMAGIVFSGLEYLDIIDFRRDLPGCRHLYADAARPAAQVIRPI